MGNWVTALGLPEVFEGLLCCTTSTLSALCSSCTTSYPRFIFSLFLLFGTTSSFLVLSPNMRSTLDKLPYFCTAVTTEDMCDNLVGYGAVYRICFSLALFYGVFSLLMLNTNSTKDIRVRFHNGYWFVKLVLLVVILVGAFHIPRHTQFGPVLMYVGLTAGFVFIMIQILLVIDFAHSWSFSWAERIKTGNSNFWSFALVFSTILVYSMAITMAVFYYLYFTDLRNLSKCRGNMFFISFNVFHCLLASVISILPRVQDTAPGSGLLQSSIVSLYTMYLTWCTLSSEPDGACNPMGDVILEYDKVSGVNGQAIFDCVLMFALLIFACNVRSSTSKLEKIGFSLSKYPVSTREQYSDNGEESTVNYREKNDAEKYVGEENIDGEECTEYNYSFFHFVMFLASLQLMMVVTNWHSPNELADLKKLVKNWPTVWIQLTSSFLCVLFYIWATVAPLLLRTWGPCLGLDYERVPTVDDYNRVRRRREMIRERRKMQKYDFTSSKIETNLTDITVTNERSWSKNYKVEHGSDNSLKTSEQKIGNLSLSLVKNQTEQTTQDSGMYDVSNLTSHSRSFSRASARENLSKSTTVDTRVSPEHSHRSESALSSQTVCNEKYRTRDTQVDMNTDKPRDSVIDGKYSDVNVASLQSVPATSETSKRKCSNRHTLELERGDKSNSKTSESAVSSVNQSELTNPSKEKEIHRQEKLGSSYLNSKSPTLNTKQDKTNLLISLSRPQSAQLRFNKYTGKQQKTNTRPHSSMAFTNKTFTEATHNRLIDKKTLTTRPKTCEPSFTLQKKSYLRRKKENERTWSFEGNISSESTTRNQLHETSIVCQETDNIQSRLLSQENHGESSKTVEEKRPTSGLSSSVDDLITQTDNLNVLKSTERAILPNRTDQNKEEVTRGREILNDGDSKPDTRTLVVGRNYDTTSEKSTTAPLKLQDHLKWVKSLCRTRGKDMPLKKRDISEIEASVEDRTDAEEKVKNTSSKGGRKQSLIIVSESLNAGSHRNETNRDTSNKNQETLDQCLRTEGIKKETASNDKKPRWQSELQTPDAAKEILRLQEKILKFQAKVVKTQQKILEMRK